MKSKDFTADKRHNSVTNILNIFCVKLCYLGGRCHCLEETWCFLLQGRQVFYPGDGGSRFLLKVGTPLLNQIAPHPGGQQLSVTAVRTSYVTHILYLSTSRTEGTKKFWETNVKEVTSNTKEIQMKRLQNKQKHAVTCKVLCVMCFLNLCSIFYLICLLMCYV